MKQTIKYASDVRQLMKEGIDTLTNAVKATLGPGGRNVIVWDNRGYLPFVSKDGVTVANNVSVTDPIRVAGADLVRAVAKRTNEEAGDGTTTATVLAQAIYHNAIVEIDRGKNPMEVCEEIKEDVAHVVNYLKSISRKVQNDRDIETVATISANGSEFVGRLISEAWKKAGEKDAVITVEESKTGITHVEVKEGIAFASGLSAPTFITDSFKNQAEYENVAFIICDYEVNNPEPMKDLIVEALNANMAVVVIAHDITGVALQDFMVNKAHHKRKIAAIRAPYMGETRSIFLSDLAVLTGGRVVKDDGGRTLKGMRLADAGYAARIISGRTATTIIGPGVGSRTIKEDAVKLHLGSIKNAIADAKTAGKDSDVTTLSERYARLTGKVGTIYVGGKTQSEAKELKDRVEDALNATRAAVEEGIIPGGGAALYHASKNMNTGVVSRSIQEPMLTILRNAGYKEVVWWKFWVRGKRMNSIVGPMNADMCPVIHGYNHKTGSVEDLMIAGVFDPVKVTRLSLENAASIASLLSTVECMVVTELTPDELQRMGAGR